MHTTMTRISRLGTRAAAFFLVAAGTATCLQAQSPQTAAVATRPSLDLHASLVAPLDLSVPAGSSSSISDAAGDPAADSERTSLSNISDVNQPPPRRRYGRPRYADRGHNADGSNKLAIVLGGGFTVPVGGTGRDLTTSYHFLAGGGYNFSKKFGVIAQFDYDHFGLPGSVIAAQQAQYQNLQILDPTTGSTIDLSGLDANSHIWSITLNPTFTVVQGERSSAYVVVGGGLYHKAVNFTLPQTGTYCDYYYGCYQVQSNQNFDTYTNNSIGVNGGLGFTYKLSRFSNAKLFTEARYVWVANQKTNTTAAQGNYYPQANNRTGYIPVTVGVRW
jgi:hypothetical protein